MPLSNSLRLARLLPGAELAVVDQCGHMPQEEWPGLFTALVDDWLARRVLAGSSCNSSGSSRSGKAQ